MGKVGNLATNLSFEARFRDDFEAVSLVKSEKSRVPLSRASKSIIPFDDWASAAPAGTIPAVARLMQAWADNEMGPDQRALITVQEDCVLLHPAFAASLEDADAIALGLPPAAKLSLNLQSRGAIHQPDFRIDLRWTRPNGLPASAIANGSRLRWDNREWRIPEPIWSTLGCVSRLNDAQDEGERQAALAELKAALGDEGSQLVQADGYVERLRLSYAAGFSLELKASAQGFDFDPVLFSKERLSDADEGKALDEAADSLLPPVQQSSFAKSFKRGDGSRRAYLLEDGAILFLDPGLHRVLKVVRKAQAGSSEIRKAFARNPQRAITEGLQNDGIDPTAGASLFVETEQFSQRVSGIDVWRKPVLPWIKPKSNSWLPESFGIRVGEGDDAQFIELTPESAAQALKDLDSAIQADRPTFSVGDGEVPATEQAREALTSIADLVAAVQEQTARGDDDDGAPGLNRYFLQVRENLEDVAYAPLVEEAAQRDLEAVEFPSSVASAPKPHQIDGFQWLVDCWRSGVPGALLADDMGLGKTFQALAFLAWLKATDQGSKPILIVAPTGLLANWRAEVERHLKPNTLGQIVNAYGSALSRSREGAGRDIDVGASTIDLDAWSHAGVILTTFETMRDYHLSFARQPFSVIVYDEVQKLKNPASQMTRAAKTLNGRFQIAMTGTPVENRLQDLWSIFDVVHPGLLGSSRGFETSYPSNDLAKLKSLYDLLAQPKPARPQLLLRRMKDDCLVGLPAKHIKAMPAPMPPVQASAYEKVIQRAIIAKGSGRKGYMLETLHQLRGVSLHPVSPDAAAQELDYFSQSARLRILFEQLETIDRLKEKALIFCESLAMQALLAHEIRRRFKLNHDIARIHGGVTGESRQAAVDQFQTRGPGFDVMILSPKAGGVGLTLTAANHVIHLSRWWNPAVEDQATDRAYRIGQTRDVTVYLPQAIHPDPTIGVTSFDLKLDALMRRKRELSSGLLIPGDDDDDAAALLSDILGEVADVSDEAAESPRTTPAAAENSQSEVLTPTPPQAPTQASRPADIIDKRLQPPQRKVFSAGTQRDFSIFAVPLANEQIESVTVRDPYACSSPSNRGRLLDFVKMLQGTARSINLVLVTCLDAESVNSNYPETNARQFDDLNSRWKQRIGHVSKLKLQQISKRQVRDFHDRIVTAKTASGRKLTWDLGRGVDGLMNSERECTVNFFEET